jgi:hypothetical protein
MQDRPTIRELLEAVEHFLESDLVRILDGPKQYHARVAANVMRIIARELDLGPESSRAEWRRLDALLEPMAMPEDERALRKELYGRTRELCALIRRGDADEGPWRRRVLAHVRQTIEEKLAIAKPEMLRPSEKGLENP